MLDCRTDNWCVDSSGAGIAFHDQEQSIFPDQTFGPAEDYRIR
jgi:hypothetical protein